jgi:hypothetical protein
MKARWLALLLIACTPKDPSAGFFQTKEEARNYDCARMSLLEAHDRFPGVVPEPAPRGSYAAFDALVCNRRFVEWGEREPRDEVILTELGGSVSELTRLATSAAPPNARWYVDAFYPSPEVSRKIAVATRISLLEHGQQVSDRVPVLAAGDIAVLARMPSNRAYSVACGRYFKEQVLHSGEIFLGVMIIDAREEQLHAGMCVEGEWRWLL